MTDIKKKSHEPLFHVSKNDAAPVSKSITIRIIAIAVALVIIGILSFVLIKENPIEIFKALFTGAFIDVGTLIQNTSLLLMFGLAVVPAFKMKYWNMGANGQVLVGCLASIACMKFIPAANPEIDNNIVILCMLAAGIAASVIWAIIPALFKAFFNTNETLFTLMMNYIAVAVVNYFVFVWDKSGSGTLKTVNFSFGSPTFRKGWLFPDSDKYIITLVVAVVMTLFTAIYMRYSKHGFEVCVVGESVNTAKYVGINVKKVIVRTLVLSGIFCGIIGFLYASCLSHTVNADVGGKGFTAILVAWLAGFDPLVMVITSFFVVFINTGAENVSNVFHLNSNDSANIVVGIIFFCIIGCEFFIRYKVHFNGKKLKSAAKEAE